MDMFARDPELLRLYDAGTHDFEGLSPDERLHFASLMGTMMHRFESLVAQTEQGFLPAESWDGAANRLRSAFALPGTLAWWGRGKHVFNAQLQTWVEEQIVAKAPSPPAA